MTQDKSNNRGSHTGSLHSISVLVSVSIAVMKHLDQKQVGEERFIWLTLPHYRSSLKEVKAGAQTGQELGGRS